MTSGLASPFSVILASVSARRFPILWRAVGAGLLAAITACTGNVEPTRSASAAPAAAAVLAAPSAKAASSAKSGISTSQSGGIVYLTSTSGGHTARIGLNTAWGGAIVEVSLDGVNFVDAHDTGREVQPSLYDGAAPYTNFNCSPCNGTWGWNPVLGGDKYNHGSPVTNVALGTTTLSVAGTALEWNPDDKGGGAGVPVVSDVTVQQTVSVVSGSPLAFHVHMTTTYTGKVQHYSMMQELPAVYAGSQYNRFMYYGGTTPWSNGALSTATTTATSTQYYTGEQWGAFANSSGSGLTVYVPGQYPFTSVGSCTCGGGSGPTGNAFSYFLNLTPATIGPGSVITQDLYLIPGSVTTARSTVYAIHQTASNADTVPPLAAVEAPAAGATLTGTSYISGWAIDNVAVSSVTVLVDNVLLGTTPTTIARADVVAAYPHVASATSGWAVALNSAALSNGPHTVLVKVQDSSGNVTIMPPVSVTVKN